MDSEKSAEAVRKRPILYKSRHTVDIWQPLSWQRLSSVHSSSINLDIGRFIR